MLPDLDRFLKKIRALELIASSLSARTRSLRLKRSRD
jgi:hypothetical protein